MSPPEFQEKETVQCPQCQKHVPVGYSVCPYCGTDLRDVFRLKATYELTLRDTLNRIKRLTLSPLPTEIYSKIAVSPDYAGPFLIILVVAGLLTMRLFSLSIFTLTFSFNWISVTLAFTFTAVLTSLAFLLYSFICDKILRLLGGSGKFDQTFSILGYSAIPLIFGLIVTDVTVFLLPNLPDISAFLFFPFFIWFTYFAGIGFHIAHGVSKGMTFSVVFLLFLGFIGFMAI